MLSTDKYQPVGDESVGYPQICIRTNRTPERTNIKPMITAAMAIMAIAKNFPWNLDDNEKEAIIKGALKILGIAFGSGGFGHAWVIYFNSAEEGDNTSYAFHPGYGFVKNSEHSSTNDSPERKFHMQHCVKINNKSITPEFIEQTFIPELIDESNQLSKMMKMTSEDMQNGAYTPVTNCSWFAGKLWNQIMQLEFEQPAEIELNQVEFEQSFENYINLDELADKLGLPLVKDIRGIGDPGMLAENIKNNFHI
ncbi:hypothetical protein [Xenorhabdus innexi]|uniref:Uncharacterized protein n=1 Tax=Xenorhabdus innexi TaxID=290109 RepID=A0A1N6MQS1_9GAMM|nr:hypothetical protein [Xenorhabdus innexi]PHM30671.1 hypothetical protein Xinn_03229 [Xenorhabdus innexi]SIP71193.1 conserved hypothetical protein [Xenorhabdus innexi]